MGSADRISINTDRLACTWKAKMEKEDSIKEERGNEIRGSRKREKSTVASRTDFVIKAKRNR